MTDRQTTFQTYREAADAAHPVSASMESRTELWNRAEYAEFVLERTKKRLARVERSRNWGWSLFVIVLVFALMLLARVAIATDPLNDSLHDAARESIRSVNAAQYLTLYAERPEDRDDLANAVSFIALNLSHAGVPTTPLRLSDTTIKIAYEIYDPFSTAWRDAGAKLTDPRFISDQQSATVTFSDGSTAVCSIIGKKTNGFTVSHRGRTFDVHSRYVTKIKGVAVPPWLDIVTAQGFYERTGSFTAMVDAREWIMQAGYAPLYHDYRNHPKTVFDWLEQRELGRDLFQFGKFGVRGWNQNESGVTLAQRGGERKLDGTYVTADVNKYLALTDARNVFAHPDRKCAFDGGEGIGPTFCKGMDLLLWDAKGNRIDQADPSLAIDDSWTHSRPLRTGIACWSCHYKKRGDETNGVIPFAHTGEVPGALDYQKAAQLSAYYGYADQLQRDARRDREDYADAIAKACNGMKPSEVMEVVNRAIDAMTVDPVTPERACRELGLAVKTTPELTLTDWLSGVSSDVFGELSVGHSVNYGRFRLAMPIALAHIAARRHALGER